MKINVDTDIGRPVTTDASAKFASYIGVVTRDVISVPVKWSELKKDDLDPIFRHLDMYMDVNMDDPGVKDCLIERFKSSTRQEHYRWHQYFKKFNSVEEAKMNKPEKYADAKKWKEFCDHFASEKFKVKSVKNSSNRNKVKAPYISGRKPFTVPRHEISQNELNGEPCDRIDLYKQTHYSIRKGWSSQQASETWNLMIEKRNQYNEQDIQKTEDEIVQEVLGLGTGYIKGLGYGPKSPLRRLSSDYIATQKLQNELSNTQKKLSESQLEVNILKSQVTDCEIKVSELNSTIHKLLDILKANGMNVD